MAVASNTRNLWLHVCLCPLQVFHCHFNNNFFPLFLEHLLSDNISASTGSVLLGKISFIERTRSQNRCFSTLLLCSSRALLYDDVYFCWSFYF